MSVSKREPKWFGGKGVGQPIGDAAKDPIGTVRLAPDGEPWPWPWENSQTTDYAYAFDGGAVHASCFGSAWFTVDPEAEAYGEPEDDDGAKVPFPDMSSRKGDWNHIMSRSGLITVSLPEHEK
jgi:hypothetical protein